MAKKPIKLTPVAPGFRKYLPLTFEIGQKINGMGSIMSWAGENRGGPYIEITLKHVLSSSDQIAFDDMLREFGPRAAGRIFVKQDTKLRPFGLNTKKSYPHALG